MREKAKRVMQFHEVANIFPLMEGEEFQALVNDIRKNGLQEAIWTYQDKIIDGRNRYSAVLRLQEQGHPIVPKFREWNGKGNLLAFVVSLNLHRRHLTESQRAMIVAGMSKGKKGRPKENGSIEPFMPRQQAADMLNVSPSSAKRASKVTQHGDEGLINAVRSGEMSVSAAEQVVDAAEKYPEVAAIKGARPQDRLTISKNLDKLPEKERTEKLKLLVKGDSDTLTELAEKPPMPKPKPASSFDKWDEHLDKVERTFIDLERATETLAGEWDSDEKERFLNKLTDIESQITNIESIMLRSADYDERREGAESATAVH